MQNENDHQYFMRLLGAKGRHSANIDQIGRYKQIFRRLDADSDGQVTLQDYLERSIFNDPDKIRGIFNATDRNKDGIITEEEYESGYDQYDQDREDEGLDDTITLDNFFTDVQKMTDPMSPIKEETKYTLFEDAKEKES